MRPYLLLVLVLAMACRGDNTSPPPDRGRDVVATHAIVPAPLPPCTKHWKNPVNGIWGFAVNWSPAGVPGATDVVCIDAPGSYTVSSFNQARIDALVLGGVGSTPTLVFTAPSFSNWSITTGIDIRDGTMTIDSTATILTGVLSVSGTLHARRSFTEFGFDSLVNRGTIDVDALTILASCRSRGATCNGAPGIRNTGTFRGSGRAEVYLLAGSDFLMEGGSLNPSQGMGIRTLGGAVGSFVWSNGSVGNASPFGSGVTVYDGTALRFVGAGATGSISAAGASHVTGDIPSGATLLAYANDTFTSTTFRSQLNGPLVNRGALLLSMGLTVKGKGIINAATLEILDDVALDMDSLVNRPGGSIVASATATVSTLLRNRGTISASGAGALDIVGTYASEAGATHTGPMTVHRGVVSGSGTLGDLSLFGGRLDPGGTGIGALQLSSLAMDGGSTLAIDVGGTVAGAHDALTIAGPAVYDGTLALREMAPFQAGGCGQVITFATDASGAVSRKGFARLTGAAPGAGRGWRTWMPTDSLQLVGHDPAFATSLAPTALAVTEGGAAASYSVCLRTQPTAAVTIAPAGGPQLSPPATLSFTTTRWALPQSTSISAVNDLIVEASPITVAVTHKVTSADPAFNLTPASPLSVTVNDNDGRTNHELAITSVPPVTSVGQSFTMSFRDVNLGPDASGGATVNIPASAGFTYSSATGAACAYDTIWGTTCQLAGAPAGAGIDFTITFIAASSGSWVTTVTLTTVQSDPNLANNVRTQTITIN